MWCSYDVIKPLMYIVQGVAKKKRRVFIFHLYKKYKKSTKICRSYNWKRKWMFFSEHSVYT